MTELAVRETSTEIRVFDPSGARTHDAKLTAVIEYAKRVKDWPLLEQAVDLKIEEQTEFAQWWDDHVSVSHGAGRGKKNSDLNSFSLDDAERLTGISQVQMSRLRKKLKDVPSYRAKLYGKAWAEAFGGVKPHVSNNSGENEWYTPPDLIAAAREVMGGIDLDPASCELANSCVQATKYFTAQDNGLTKAWFGRLWLNPPYSQPLMSQFSAAVVSKRDEYDAACVLVNNATDTDWLQIMLGECNAACFLRGRVKFIDKEGDPSGAPLQGQVVLYFGDDSSKFADVFCGFGWVCARKDP